MFVLTLQRRRTHVCASALVWILHSHNLILIRIIKRLILKARLHLKHTGLYKVPCVVYVKVKCPYLLLMTTPEGRLGFSIGKWFQMLLCIHVKYLIGCS